MGSSNNWGSTNIKLMHYENQGCPIKSEDIYNFGCKKFEEGIIGGLNCLANEVIYKTDRVCFK